MFKDRLNKLFINKNKILSLTLYLYKDKGKGTKSMILYEEKKPKLKCN